MERKQALIEALKNEAEIFLQRGQSTKEHDLAIKYLETGIVPDVKDIYEHELLQACVDDFDTVCSDYEV